MRHQRRALRLHSVRAMYPLALLAATLWFAQISIVRAGGNPGASGNGTFTTGSEQYSFSFHAGFRQNGLAEGAAQFRNQTSGARFRVKINCLSIDGSIARLSGVITDHADPNVEGNTAIFGVRDNGNGKNAPPDEATPVFYAPPGSPTNCEDLDAEAFLMPLESGNVRVRS